MERRSIYTNNPKKGGPGFSDTYRLISGETYKYVPDEFQRGRTLEKTMKAEARARIPKPFWGGTKAPLTFTSDRELYARPPPPKQRHSSANDRPNPWRPNNPAPKGPYCGLLSPPAYVPCPDPAPRSPRRPFIPASAGHKRLSMWTVNPYEREPIPPHEPDGAVFL
ncbi:hypothetical protein GPECTOR_171g194 [Gonium pectorale]|uniref:Cilia-and flagella-associated protein 96 n=1 Tax=Gonium pectorale TaxID=33097 RepID=A0A150FXF7_GONPE|nr:hypothetical protein GPECTOR_171g194 [Gonium pectorale]|eukprot:KXZ42268.1 hypothetical protein GPECTOR_171g194 [Gonium pectorale]